MSIIVNGAIDPTVLEKISEPSYSIPGRAIIGMIILIIGVFFLAKAWDYLIDKSAAYPADNTIGFVALVIGVSLVFSGGYVSRTVDTEYETKKSLRNCN